MAGPMLLGRAAIGPGCVREAVMSERHPPARAPAASASPRCRTSPSGGSAVQPAAAGTPAAAAEAGDLAHEQPQVDRTGGLGLPLERQPRLDLLGLVLPELLHQPRPDRQQPVGPILVPLGRGLRATLQSSDPAQDVELGSDVQVPDGDRFAGFGSIGHRDVVQVAVLVYGHLESALRDVVPDVHEAPLLALVPPRVELQAMAALSGGRSLPQLGFGLARRGSGA
eukprot:CAMPEP_0170209000 /NCGR_PEP_ID=MMETSP0116_2-20130129/4087_1 /TAXON_ID=400756 /ORGANISM="Durinskia baltica, Strain CSIRO CS-38" /LENGTH=224 /DNA_ID=CAMNT_0010459477 /DNA_START=24 /DNA_END=695 /DNA_ORIENTATION=+